MHAASKENWKYAVKRLESFISVRTRQKRIWKISKVLLISFISWEIFSVYILKSYTVSSSSMSPTIRVGDKILVLPSAYGFPALFSGKILAHYAKPNRGDIILMKSPAAKVPTLPNRVLNELIRFVTLQQLSINSNATIPSKPIIKRVIAIQGDTIRIKNFIAYVKLAGSEHYLSELEVSGRIYDTQAQGLPDEWLPVLPFSGEMDAITLNEGEYFVLGDQRSSLGDSRFFGIISEEAIYSKIIARYWPLQKPFFL